MKTDVSATSIISFYDLDLGARQYEVVSAIRDLMGRNIPASCESIGKHLGYTPNRVSGRLRELEKKGAIAYDGFTKSSFGKDQQCYKLVIKGQGAML